ncbi:hypothetical protein [Streptomyces sp. AS58]|uniref:hypothetical protein n=1 Tax=Streptomyces sp. AS58 TaxID=1519489 RepID=UPI0006AF80CC|nr:hypothetical protein [Streptomyces sp. AS58]
MDNSIALDHYASSPREDLDHVLHRASHTRPASWNNNVVKEQTALWTSAGGGQNYTYTNRSDRYPVAGSGNRRCPGRDRE